MAKADGLRGVAYHEAGHAVVALALDLHVARVEIFHEDHSGATDVAPTDHLPLADQIAIYVAGINAEKLFDAPTHEGAGLGDHAKLIETLTQEHLGEIASHSTKLLRRKRVCANRGYHKNDAEWPQ
jgi:ATP-dependent Zn protease